MKRYADYRDSGIEWIGKIPKDWELFKISWLFDEIGSGTTPNSELGGYYGGDIPWLNTGDLNDGYIVETARSVTEHTLEKHSTLRKYPSDSLVIAMYGATIGKLGITKMELCTNQACCVMTKPRGITILYAFYSFMAMRSYLLSLAYGGGQPNISQGLIRSLKMPVPSAKMQYGIVYYLNNKTTSIDNLIADKQKLIGLLKEKRQAIISEAVTKGLDKNTKMKNSRIEWLGNIPDNWNTSKSQWLFSQRRERAYENDEQLTASQSLGIVYQKAYMEQENQRVVQVLKGADILKHVEENDFVISMRSFQGGIEWSGISGKISSAYVMLIPNYKYVNVQFFKWLFKSKAYITALQSTSNLIRDGQALRYDNFRQIDLPIIPLEEQEMIADYLNKQTVIIDQLIIDIKTQIENLKEYRQSIISEAVTGKTLIEVQESIVEKKAAANLHFKRRVLAAHILDALCDEPTMGHVKLEKLLFLSEHIAKLDLQTQYDRHAAGPYNPKVLRSIDTQLKKAEWFEYNATSETSNKYSKLPKSGEHETYYERYFDEQQRKTVDKLMALFHSARTIQCEIVATLYGAWNDFIIDGIQPSDDKIVDEVLTNWHEKKERIARERWLGALKWMRDNQLIPDGYGTSTKGGRK